VLRAAGPLLLLLPSCLLAMVALVPKVLATPSPGTVAVLVVLAAIALAPIVLAVRALTTQPA
jgi:hypothetical protein